MAGTQATLDFKELLSSEDLTLDRLHEARREVHCHVDLRSQVEGLLADFGAVARKLSSENKAEVRKGTSLWLIGQSEKAAEALKPLRTSKERSYVLGVSLLEAGRPAEAVDPLKEAAEADSGDFLAQAAYCEARIRAGDTGGAEGQVERLLKKQPGGRSWYLKGLLADFQGNHDEAMKSYEKALELEPGYPEALFRLAYIMDLTGEDARALELYEQLRKLRPMHLSTVMNLGVLYEDRGDFDRAAQCFQSVLDYFPNHARAQLYLKDAKASLTMFYDEDAARREAKVAQILGQPVAEIQFSPRVRNALAKLGVNTLGDLVAKTEEELLSIPNFGRTSLKELKEFMSGKGLSLASAPGTPGVAAPAGDSGAPAPAAAEAPSEDLLRKNLSDFEWSGRIRKVFEKLGLVTLDDLLKRSEKDLLKAKNLGVTSIKEIRKKLGQLGVSMRPE
jgi:DNA-directed RNA polymerase subunit alpha